MRFRRVGVVRPFARAGAIASIALIGMLLSANAALAATVIGSALSDSFTCNAGFDTVQLSSAIPGAYAVPLNGGTITSWSTQTGPFTGAVGLQVWRSLGTVPPSYQLVGASPLETTLAPLTLVNIPLVAPIVVQANDLIGLRIEGRAYCQLTTSNPLDVYGSHLGGNPTVGAIDTFLDNPTLQLDVAATVEAVIVPPPPPPPPPTTGCDSTGSHAGSEICLQ